MVSTSAYELRAMPAMLPPPSGRRTHRLMVPAICKHAPVGRLFKPGTVIETCGGMTEDLETQSETLESHLRVEKIPQRILTIRGTRVTLDADLATLYDVPTKTFNQAI